MATYRARLVAPSCASIQERAHLEVEGYPGRDGPVRVRLHTDFATVNGALVPRLLVIECDCDSESMGLARRTLGEAALDLASLIATLANAAVDAPQLERAYDVSPGASSRPFYKNFGLTFDTRERASRTSALRPTLDFVNTVRTHPERARLLRAVRHYRLALTYWPQGLETLALAHLYMGVEALSKALVRNELTASGDTEESLASRWGLTANERARQESSLRSHAIKRLLFMGDADAYDKARAASDGFEHGFKDLTEVDALATEVRDATARYLREAILRLAFGGGVPPEVLRTPYDFVVRAGPPTFESLADLHGPVENLAPVGMRHPDLEIETLPTQVRRVPDGKMEVRYSWVGKWHLGVGTTATNLRHIVVPAPMQGGDPAVPTAIEFMRLGREGSLDEG